MNLYEDWVAGLNPTNPASVLVMSPPTDITPNGVTVSWTSVSTVNYFLGYSTNLASPFTTISTNIAGQPGTTTYTVTNTTGSGPFFYRVGIAGP
jgi:hypothetical protein